MDRKELDERINKIACMVYSVDPDEPDPQQFAIEEEIHELIDEVLSEGYRNLAALTRRRG